MPDKADRERLLRIISMCIDVERKGVNPFEVEVRDVLDTLRKYLPSWKILEDFVLDAEALNNIASVISLQGNWIKHRSTSLYVDPLLIEFKVKAIDTRRLAEIFLKSWHPIVEFESLSKKRVSEAVDYWNHLVPLNKRKIILPAPYDTVESTTFEDLIKQRLISKESFNETLRNLWEELKELANQRDQVLYWAFIGAETYEETIYRAYLTSFLITYGYATMEVNPLEDEAFLIPLTERKETNLEEQSVSIPIAIDYDTWKQKRGKKFE